MFGFQGGESADTVARKKSYMKEAQTKWRFLTNLDCSYDQNQGAALLNDQDALGDLGGQANFSSVFVQTQ